MARFFDSYVLAIAPDNTFYSALDPVTALRGLTRKLGSIPPSVKFYAVNTDADVDFAGGDLVLNSGESERLYGEVRGDEWIELVPQTK